MLTIIPGFWKRVSIVLAIAALAMAGCGNNTLNSNTNNPDQSETGTLNSSISDPDWGTFELLAAGQNPETGKQDFVVRANRTISKNLLRFVWDFGNGPEGEGLTQSHAFRENGLHTITVTAYGVDNSVAFVLKLTINIGATDNQAPIVKIESDEQASENDLVFLYGGGSSDPDGDEMTFDWVQLSGPPVQILHGREASASFVAPMVEESEELGFRLIVSDGELSSHKDVIVTVNDLLNPSSIPNDGSTDAPVANGPEANPNGDGSNETEDVRVNCIASSPEWKNLTFAPQSGSFEIGFSAMPLTAFMDGIIGLSTASAARFSDSAVLIRFNNQGIVDVRNGGDYSADAQLPYIALARYQFRVVVNVSARTYSVFVTPDGGTEFKLATNYAFRTEQNTVTNLGYWNLWSDTGTTLNLCSLRLTPATPAALSVDAGQDVTLSPGNSTILLGAVTGGQGPYAYSWSPATGLNNAGIANPTATPTVTTTYTLKVTDVSGASSTDSVVVTVRAAAPLVANAGPDKEIIAGSSTQLEGSATGGTPPYSFKWIPTAGLSSATVAAPTVRPSTTTAYQLTVTDNTGATASDNMVIRVTSAPPTTGNSFVVATDAANASDSNPGTAAAPWKTLKKAASVAKAGQTVLVRAGIYYETLAPMSSGTAGNLITFKAYPGDECKGPFAGRKSDCRVVIDGQNIRENGINAYPRKYVRFEGFEIRNHGDDAVYLHGYYDNTAEGFEVVNNFIHHNGNDAITFRGDFARSILIENNEITENPMTAISSGGGSGHIIRGNNIHYNGKDGIRGGGDHLLIEYNNIYDQYETDLHPDGMDLGDTSDSILRYNTIRDCSQLMYFHDFDNGGGFNNLQIYGNVFYTDRYWTQNGGESPGIFFDARFHNSPVRNINIHSNTFAWTGYDGLWIYGGIQSNIVLRNNIFYDSGMDAESVLNSDYNLFFNSAKPPYEGSHSITGNPLFQNYVRNVAWDFRLQAGSPAIDRGDPVTKTIMNLSTDFKDINNTLRPQGTACDIGAYERAQ